MPINTPRNRFVLSLIVAGVGLALFLSGSYRNWTSGWGQPWEFLGVLVFVAGVWYSVDSVKKGASGDPENELPPQGWLAWLGLIFSSACLVTLWLSWSAFSPHTPVWNNADAGQVGRNLGLLFVSWAILSAVLRRRWGSAVIYDERDIQIAFRACNMGRIAITASVIAIALMLALAPSSWLASFSFPLLAQALMTTLLIGHWVDCLMLVRFYSHDRQSAEDG